MSQISTSAQAARENARDTDGRFGEQDHARADGVDLWADDAFDWMAGGPDEEALENAEARLERAEPEIDEQARRAEEEAARRKAERLASVGTREQLRRLEQDDRSAQKFLRNAELAAYGRASMGDLAVTDDDDLAQEAMLDTLRAQKDASDARDLATVPRSYMRRIVNARAMRTFTSVSSRDIRGNAELSRRQKALEAELGRGLGDRERDRLAEQVRMSFPPKERPSEGFHISRVAGRLDAPVGGDDDSASKAAMLAAPDDTYAAVDADPEQDRMEALLERLRQVRAKRNHLRTVDYPWQIGAATASARDQWRHPIPQPVVRSVGRSAAAATTTRISARGGAAECAKAWLDGDETVGPDLFRPFGDLDRDGQDAVADFLLEQRDEHGDAHANAAFASALTASRKDCSDTAADVTRAMSAPAPATAHIQV